MNVCATLTKIHTNTINSKYHFLQKFDSLYIFFIQGDKKNTFNKKYN